MAAVILHPIVVRVKNKSNVLLPSVGQLLLELDSILFDTCTGPLNVIHRYCTIPASLVPGREGVRDRLREISYI